MVSLQACLGRRTTTRLRLVLSELVQTALDRYLPIAELTVPWFKEVAALEGKLLTAPYHNEKIAAIKSRPRVRELASYFTSRPDTKVYLPHSVYSLFWQMIQPA